MYTYSYQVSDDPEQTYIQKTESRDGDDVTGSYQYVDALGQLVKVTYQAGVMGYTEEREVTPNFVTIRARPAAAAVSSVSSSAAPAISSVRTVTAAAPARRCGRGIGIGGMTGVIGGETACSAGCGGSGSGCCWCW